MSIDVGQLIGGKYELVRLLATGAMGEVWLARHRTLGGQLAVKLMSVSPEGAPEKGRFQLEAQIAASLSRKTRHVVSVSDHGEEAGLAYLVMELLEGETLEAKLARGSLAVSEVKLIVTQLARALALAHEEGIVHRDLKPANVWLGRDEHGGLLVKLLDFGVARTLKARSPFATTKDMILGTPSYMSPEQARGLETLDHRCDVWALAVVAYEALATKIPFEGETAEDIFLAICTFRVRPIHRLRPDLPPGVDRFFTRAFAPQLRERFASAAELAAAFEEVVEAEARGGDSPVSSSDALNVARGSRPEVETTAGREAYFPPLRRAGKAMWLFGVVAILATLGFASAVFGSFNAAARRPEPDASVALVAPVTPPPPRASSPPEPSASASAVVAPTVSAPVVEPPPRSPPQLVPKPRPPMAAVSGAGSAAAAPIGASTNAPVDKSEMF